MSDKLRVKRNKIIGRAMKISRVKTAFDNAWYIHARMFGDIMDPAFTDDMAARFERVISHYGLMVTNEMRTLPAMNLKI